MTLFSSDWPFLAVAAGAAGALWFLRRPAARTANPSPSEARATPAPSARHLAVLQYAELVARTGAQVWLEGVRTRLAFTPEAFRQDVEPLLQRFAEFVQLLPASESHHHAQPGGLLLHLLEVACHALHFRDALKLPLGTSTEEQSRLAARYSYAVLIGALLHDIGKPVSDVQVQLVKRDGTEQAWVALGGSMVEQGGAWYTVDFPEQRQYDRHGRLALILLQRLVPPTALTWLGQYPPVLNELTDYLSGERTTGPIAELVARADRQSVADNLLQGPRTRFASARAVPLIERLMAGLRRLLAEGGLPLNRAGAAAFCDGTDLWCVAGTVAKAVREYLAQHEEKSAGAAGIPTDNSRLFDTWQEYGALIPNPAGGAIWNVRVTIGAWQQVFTVIRFPLDKLYARADQYPAALPAGAIDAIEAPAAAMASTTTDALPAAAVPILESEAPAAAMTVAADPIETPAAEPSGGPSRLDDCGMSEAELAVALAPEPAAAAKLSVSAAVSLSSIAQVAPDPDDGFLDERESAASLLQAEPALPKTAPDQLSAPLAPRPKQAPRAPKQSQVAAKGPQPRPNAERFMAWIQQGVADGSLVYNEANALVHFVEQGLLIVSPKAFQDYAQRFPNQIEISASATVQEPWRVLQRDFQRSGYPCKAAGGTYIHYFTVAGPGSKQLVGLVVPSPERFFKPVPSANPVLTQPKSTPNDA